ncbi:hypothetical protein [Azospirillum rugosum]|uniref:hypothetical protein n=1 Tax=Azospirillum rugosum TaxID=416170 RepID=UPI001AE15E86|nr:hypothetical protein [Azospirillum rugosum]
MSWLSKLSGRGKGNAAAQTAPKERPANPPYIRVDRHEYLPEEFALGSFRIRPYDGDLIAKQQFDFRIGFELANETVEFACRGIVVKMTEETGLVARYQHPQPFYERKLIEYLRLWKGI